MSKQPFLLTALQIGFACSLGAQVTQTVTSDMDIYQAGGNADASGGSAPLMFSFTPGPGQRLSFPSVTGVWTCQSNLAYYGPDGTTLPGNCLTGGRKIPNAVGALSAYAGTDFAGALVGVFLEDSLPAVAPSGLRFYISNTVNGGIPTDFLRLAPNIGQVFFIGDGLTGTGTGHVQVFEVPPTATRLYLGYVDSCNNTVPGCFGDNAGQVTVLVHPL